MKRKLAILLSIILAGMSLAGCSQVERGYLNMNKQILTSSEYQTTGSLSGEIDFDALANLLDKTVDQLWMMIPLFRQPASRRISQVPG